MAEHKRLPAWRRGAPITADRLNKMQNTVIRGFRGSPGVATQVRGSNVTITNTQRTVRDLGLLQMMRIDGIQNDYLECFLYNAVDDSYGEDAVYVAKPFMLQRTPFDGETISYPNGQDIEYSYSEDHKRTADDGSSDETQVVIPYYYANEIILAVRNVSGGTGITVGDVMVQWVDLNTAGRFWAKEA